MTFSDQLRDLIVQQHTTPSHLAKLSGIHKSSMSKFMNGGSLSLESIDKLSKVIGLYSIATKFPEPAIQSRPKK